MKFTLLIAFLCTFKWEYYSPHYESRGVISMYHPFLRIGCFCTWADVGFRKKYGPEIGVKYGDGHIAFIYWDYYYWTRPLTFRFHSW